MLTDSDPVVDLAFALAGDRIPADHGYALLGALARHLPDIHGDRALAIHPITGTLVGNRQLALNAGSMLTVRAPVTRLPGLVALAGQQLDLDGHLVRLGLPVVRPLVPAPTLRSRLVTIKGFVDAEPFLDAARRQLAEQRIAGEPALLRRQAPAAVEGARGSADPLLRRTVRVRDRQIVGYAVAVTGLDAPASLTLQTAGLGGRRRFGCGVFVPWPR